MKRLLLICLLLTASIGAAVTKNPTPHDQVLALAEKLDEVSLRHAGTMASATDDEWGLEHLELMADVTELCNVASKLWLENNDDLACIEVLAATRYLQGTIFETSVCPTIRAIDRQEAIGIAERAARVHTEYHEAVSLAKRLARR